MPVISDELIERPTVETDDPAITGGEVRRFYSDYIQEWFATESGRRRQIFEWAEKKSLPSVDIRRIGIATTLRHPITFQFEMLKGFSA